MWWAVTSLFLVLVTAAEGLSATAREGEWIAIARRPAEIDWIAYLKSLRGIFQPSDPFGPTKQFMLLRSVQKRGVAPRSDSQVLIQPNYIYRASEQNDPEYSKSWGLKNVGQAVGLGNFLGLPGKDIGAELAWTVTGGSPSVVVAIVDTGVDLHHEDLQGSLWRNKNELQSNRQDDDGNGFIDDVHGWNFVGNNADVSDDNDHGTLCAGIVGSSSGNGKGSRGVSDKVKLMILKALDANGLGATADAVKALEYAVKNGAHVINASWGGTNYDPALYDMVKWVGKQGVLFVASAGNEARDNDTDANPNYPSSFRLNTLLSVAAYDAKDQIADFSNYGKETVHIGAPGVEIFSTKRNGYRWASGTSFAAPFVSGAAALVKSIAPELSLEAWRNRLLWSSEVIHYYEKEHTQTSGRVHVGNAVLNRLPERPIVPKQWNFTRETKGTFHPYTNDLNETFRFRSPGARHLRVRFSGFDTEACCDTVEIRDGAGVLVRKYSGNLGAFTSADVLGDELRVEFHSDYSGTAYGVEIEGYEVSAE